MDPGGYLPKEVALELARQGLARPGGKGGKFHVYKGLRVEGRAEEGFHGADVGTLLSRPRRRLGHPHMLYDFTFQSPFLDLLTFSLVISRS